jgi:hypothetical protein
VSIRAPIEQMKGGLVAIIDVAAITAEHAAITDRVERVRAVNDSMQTLKKLRLALAQLRYDDLWALHRSGDEYAQRELARRTRLTPARINQILSSGRPE